jgi:hypothetical protein
MVVKMAKFSKKLQTINVLQILDEMAFSKKKVATFFTNFQFGAIALLT